MYASVNYAWKGVIRTPSLQMGRNAQIITLQQTEISNAGNYDRIISQPCKRVFIRAMKTPLSVSDWCDAIPLVRDHGPLDFVYNISNDSSQAKMWSHKWFHIIPRNVHHIFFLISSEQLVRKHKPCKHDYLFYILWVKCIISILNVRTVGSCRDRLSPTYVFYIMIDWLNIISDKYKHAIKQ